MAEQKVVLITGGSAGIGEATAIEFAKLGYKVVITGRNQERIDNVLSKLAQIAPVKNFVAFQANFEDPVQVEPIIDKTISAVGRLDVLVNNAGYSGKSHSFDHPDFYQDYTNILQVNLMAPTRLAQLAAPHLIKTKGVLINVSSVAEKISLPWAGYCVSKAGLSMLGKTISNYLGNSGVRVVTVSPGPVMTNFAPPESMKAHAPSTSLGRIGEAKEVADLIIFLCSDKASFIHGSTVDVDGGFSERLGSLIMAPNKPQ